MRRTFQAFGLLFVLLAYLSQLSAQDTASGKLELDCPIELAVRYLAEHCDENGRFDYIVHTVPVVDSSVYKPNDYNQVRHAGALYSLAQAYDWAEKKKKVELQHEILKTMKRAAGFMLKRIGPVPEFGWNDENNESPKSKEPVYALWSPKEEIDLDIEIGLQEKTKDETAKLGGAGLALLSLCPLATIDSDFVSKETLVGLGCFIDKMVLSDGSTIGSIDGLGRVKDLTSVYFPGEAALGLCGLQKFEPNDRRLKVVEKILSYLAEADEKNDEVNQDHWPIQAAEALFALQPPKKQWSENEKKIVRHAIKVTKIFLEQQVIPENGFDNISPDLFGSLNEGGMTCSTATRLEALGAARNVLPILLLFGEENEKKEITQLLPRVLQAQERGLQFLVRHQIQSGPGKGGIPQGVILQSIPDDPRQAKEIRKSNQMLGDIQIDFLQHFLSAMLRYY